MKKVAFVGPENYYRSFQLLGFDCFEAGSKEEAEERIEKLKNDYGLIFTTEDLVSSGGLGVVVLPGLKEDTENVALENQIQKALGGEVSSSFLDSS